MSKLITNLGVWGAAIIVIGLLIFGTWIVIWARNTLFGAYAVVENSLESWFAVIILLGAMKTTVTSKSKS